MSSWSWIDIFSLLCTLSVIAGVVYGVVIAVRVIESGWTSTKDSMKEKGLELSSSGMSVKMQSNLGREAYLDATQRGIVRAVNAASFRKGGAAMPPASPVSIERESSKSSSSSEKERKWLWRKKDKAS